GESPPLSLSPRRKYIWNRLEPAACCVRLTGAQDNRKARNLLMTKAKGLTAVFSTLALLACLNSQAGAAQCGNGPGGFEAWKQQFAGEARAKRIGGAGVAALMGTNY